MSTSSGVDSSIRAWQDSAVAAAENYADEKEAEAAERRRQADSGHAQPGDGFDPTRPAGATAPSGGPGRNSPPTVGSDGKPLTEGQRGFYAKVPPDEVEAFLQGGYELLPDGEGGWWIDTRTIDQVDVIDKAPVEWLPEYGQAPAPQPLTGTGGGANDPNNPPLVNDPPIAPSIVQLDDLSPKGLVKLGAAIVVGIGKLFGKEVAEKLLKEGAERVGKEVLNVEQLTNLARFESKLPSAARATTIVDVPGGGKVFQAEVPGKVPGSKAVYEKYVGPDGKTLGYTKTTFDPQGNVVHVKDKISPEGK